MALALLMPPKAKAAPANADLEQDDRASNKESVSPAAPDLTGRWDFGRLFNVEADPTVVASATESARKVQDLASNAVEMTAEASKELAEEDGKFVPEPMSYEEIRLWLQSYNAGPYATLKYKGDVPYKETRNYVPKVLKYYDQDLSSEYDPYIEKAAAKYGLDPQMIRAVMKTESNFRNDTVSHAGARGLLQVMPVVWKDIEKKYKFNWNYHTDVFEPEKNIEVACAYLAWLRYDFLPRHFATFDRHPDAPSVLVRDVDRGVPDRKSPRIIAKSDTSTPRTGSVEVASTDVTELVSGPSSSEREDKAVASSKSDQADSDDKKQVKSEEKASSDKKSEESAKASSKSDDKPVAKAPASKTDEKKAESSSRPRVIVTDSKPSGKAKGSSGKAISITVSKGGKVLTRSKGASADTKDAELARSSSREKSTREQGG